MNDKTAHDKLKKIVEDNNGYKNSRRENNKRHESFNEALNEMKKFDLKAKNKN